MTKEIFESTLLDEEEQWYDNHHDDFVSPENQNFLHQQLVEAANNYTKKINNEKKQISVNLDINAISYFKELAEDTGISYQNLINLYLLQCAQEKKKLQ